MLRFINYFSSCFEEIKKRVKVKYTEHFVKQMGGQGRMHLQCSLTKLVTPAITELTWRRCEKSSNRTLPFLSVPKYVCTNSVSKLNFILLKKVVFLMTFSNSSEKNKKEKRQRAIVLSSAIYNQNNNTCHTDERLSSQMNGRTVSAGNRNLKIWCITQIDKAQAIMQ